MDTDEIALLQDYKSYYQNNVDPITVTNGLRTQGCIDAPMVKGVYDVDRTSFGDRAEVWKEVIQIIIKQCPFRSFLTVLDTTGYTDLSLELSVHIRSIKGSLNDVVRPQRGICRGSNHKFAQELFLSLKLKTHNNAFKNPREKLRGFSQGFRANFLQELDSDKKMVIADKYAACLCAEIDSHTILYVNKNFPTHGLFKELEDLITETSNTRVTEVAFKSRMAIACAIAEDTEKGEEFLADARVASYHIGPCVQLNNMLYIQVFNYLCKFENNPTDDLRGTIMKLSGMSLQALEDEDNVTRTFWKRRILLRMVYCLLGISNRCDLIPRCVTRQKNIDKAKQLMAEIDKIWDGIESRRRMFYHVARARLHDLDSRRVKQEISDVGRKSQTERAMSNIEAAILQIEKAIDLGEEGNFGETCYVKSYASEVKEKKLQIILQQTDGSARVCHGHSDVSDKSVFVCKENSYEDKITATATENIVMTSYQACRSGSLITQSSDKDTSSAEISKVLDHDSLTDKDESVSLQLQKDALCIPNTRGIDSLTNADLQSKYSLGIQQEQKFSDKGRHQVLVSQHDIHRPLFAKPATYHQHLEACKVHKQDSARCRPGNAHHVKSHPENLGHESENGNRQPGIVESHFRNLSRRLGITHDQSWNTNSEGVNVLHDTVDAHNQSQNTHHQPRYTNHPHHQPGIIQREFGRFRGVTQEMNNRRLPMHQICQSQPYDAQQIYQPESATYQQHIERQVNQRDLRQPESATYRSDEVFVDTLLDGPPADKNIK